MAFSARILLDSISDAGARLTTMEARYPRFIHSELMTHRVFCLEAGTRLYFDLPSRKGDTKRYTMTIAEFHDRWHAGAKRSLEKMNLRSCDEDTRVISHTHVSDIAFSGYLPVYRVTTADGKTITTTAEHRFLTPTGWSTLREAANLNLSVNGIATWNGAAQVAVNGVEALHDADWLRDMREKGYSAQAIADRLNVSVDQVQYRFRSFNIRATNPQDVWHRSHTRPPHHRNLELRVLEHVESGQRLATFWETVGDVRLRRPFRPHRKRAVIAHFVDIIAIDYVGVRPTYDLEVAGPHHNFVADGFVVHNSRNAASSRAIPIKKMIEAVREDPAMPVFWGRNQAGMSAREEIDPQTLDRAQLEWRRALDDALTHAQRLTEKDIDLHKQLVNRLLEPFAWITVIITATEWSNFFTQRCHPDAQPEIKHVAELMLAAYRESAPGPVPYGGWHLPLIQDDERTLSDDVLCKLSVARCARVSYLTHEGRRDHEKDLELFERLLGGGANGHWSPFEHVATPLADPAGRSGNFVGWEQYRKRFPEEHAAVFPDTYSTVDR